MRVTLIAVEKSADVFIVAGVADVAAVVAGGDDNVVRKVLFKLLLLVVMFLTPPVHGEATKIMHNKFKLFIFYQSANASCRPNVNFSADESK